MMARTVKRGGLDMKIQALALMGLLAAPAGAQEAGLALAAPLAALQAAAKTGKAKADLAIVSDRTTTVSTPLNALTVKCSAADYSGPMLKVLVPGLADITVLNHRNSREGAPC